MTTRQKKISIVVPVYNMAQFIGPCLESILNQDYPHVEVIVIDAGSSDGTKEEIEKRADRLAYWVSEPDRGQSHAINKGFAKASGDVFAWLNADEEYLPGVLGEVADRFNRDDRVDYVYGYTLVCDASGGNLRVVEQPRIHLRHMTLYCGRVMPTDASFWSAEAHRKTGELDEENFQHLAMDYDWFLRLGDNVRRCRRIAKPLSMFKDHGGRKSHLAPEEWVNLWSIARRKYFERHSVSRMKLVLGWLWYGVLNRAQMGNYSLPALSTVCKIAFGGASKRRQ